MCIRDRSDVTAVEEDIEVDDIEFEDVPDPAPAPDPIPDPEPARETNTSVNDRMGQAKVTEPKDGGSSDEGNPTGPPSRGGGSEGGTGSGNSGSGQGNDESGNDGSSGVGDGGLGTGKYDGTGNGVFGRKVIYRNPNVVKQGFENQEGKLITVKVCIDRAGNVRYAELLDMETNAVISASQAKQVIREFKKYKYAEDLSAPEEQCGKLKLRIQNINTLR